MSQKITTSALSATAKKPTVLVLGGYGFIGRYTASALAGLGAHVLIGTRGGRRPGTNAAMQAERRLKFHETLTVEQWLPVLDGVDVVVNSVGILRERHGETFGAVHHEAVGALANACAAENIALLHVSALGIDNPIQNEFSLSKQRGEQAILASTCKGAIVRASVVDATDGYGSGWFHRLAQWPIWLLPASANKLLSPIKALDLAEALARLAVDCARGTGPGPSAKLLEVGCGETFSLEDYLVRLRCDTQTNNARPALVIRVPKTLARFCAHFFDLVHLTPYSIGHHELLEHNNVPINNALPTLLGRPPTPITAEPRKSGSGVPDGTSVVTAGG